VVGSNFRKRSGAETKSLDPPTPTPRTGKNVDFKKSDPTHTPLNCSPSWHLWRRGLSLAIYNRIGQLTYVRGGDRNPFFAKITTLQKYFGAKYESTRRAFHFLVANGWLEPVPNESGTYTYVEHEVWSFKYEGKCMVADVLQPWHGTADPFIGQIWAAAGGKFRCKPHWILGAKKYAPEAVVLDLFRKELAAAKERKARGDWQHTSPGQCFYKVTQHLKAEFKSNGQKKVVENTASK
jgi:hypothetical protein